MKKRGLDANWALIIVTIILVIVTSIYTFSTHKMVNILQKEFDTNNRPFVFISSLELDDSPSSLRIHLSNSGKLPAKINLKSTKIDYFPSEFS